MKKTFTIAFIILLLNCFSHAQQAPTIAWQKTIGGSKADGLCSIFPTTDGGYICGGVSTSNISGDKTENNMGPNATYDYWIVKLDSVGNIQWQNTIGGNGEDRLVKIFQIADGGYICGGYSNSLLSGDKTENWIGSNSNYDFWILKLDSVGTIQWQNTIGGSAHEILSDISKTADGGYICGGNSASNISGDKTQNNWDPLANTYDYWIVKLNSSGAVQWDKTFGGLAYEYFSSVSQTSDGGYICGGGSFSNISGNKTENSWGGDDYWILKLDSIGNIQWQNTIGGSGDESCSVFQTIDGGYICNGGSYSNISGDKTENNTGESDIWLIKLDSIGNIQWQNTIGGNKSDGGGNFLQTIDGNFLMGSNSYSNISGDKTENTHGGYDMWLLKLDAGGSILWQKTIGGSGSDGESACLPLSNGGYIIGGGSDSNISGDKSENSKGQNDFWVIKLNPDVTCSASIIPNGSVNFCSTSTTILQANTGTGLTYQWKKNGTNISGATSSNYTVTSSGTYTVVVTNSCGSFTSTGTVVTLSTAIPATPAGISATGGNTKVCPGDSKVYSISTVTGATSYTWIPPVGATITAGQGTKTVTVNYTAAFTTSDTIRVKAVNACGSSAQRILKITRNTPSTPSVITGSAFGVCNLSNVPYSITSVAGMMYNWSFNAGTANVAGGQGTNSITANFNAGYATGTLSVNASNACGTSANRTLSIKAIPATPSSITGATSVCANQQAVPYSISPIASAINYTWSGPTGSHVSDGTTTSSGTNLITTATNVTVNFGSTAGKINARANNACGSGSYKNITVTFTCREIGEMNSDEEGDVIIQPNPSAGIFEMMITSLESKSTEIKIYSPDGRLIKKQTAETNNPFTIDLTQKADGIYFIHALLKGQLISKKLVKQ